MSRPGIVHRAVVPGAVAGLVGGLAFGAAMIELGLLASIASLVRAESDVLGFVLHMLVAGVIGAGFGLFVWVQRPAAGEIIYWGLVYGAVWWFIGAVTLLPLLSGDPVAWDDDSARELLPALIGHLVYGVVTALAFVGLRRERAPIHIDRGSLARGVVAGVVGALVLGSILDDRAGVPAVSASMTDSSSLVAWVVTVGVGILAGLGYGALHPDAGQGTGPSLIRGIAYGFGWWIVAALTVIPVLAGDGLRWSVEDIRAGFATFPGYLLFLGAVVALIHHGLTVLVRALLSDDVSIRADEGIGTRGLRATGRGVVAGLAGGLLFTIVMVQIGFLSTVAEPRRRRIDLPWTGRPSGHCHDYRRGLWTPLRSTQQRCRIGPRLGGCLRRPLVASWAVDIAPFVPRRRAAVDGPGGERRLPRTRRPHRLRRLAWGSILSAGIETRSLVGLPERGRGSPC